MEMDLEDSRRKAELFQRLHHLTKESDRYLASSNPDWRRYDKINADMSASCPIMDTGWGRLLTACPKNTYPRDST
jgi:hypothetical protein